MHISFTTNETCLTLSYIGQVLWTFPTLHQIEQLILRKLKKHKGKSDTSLHDILWHPLTLRMILIIVIREVISRGISDYVGGVIPFRIFSNLSHRFQDQRATIKIPFIFSSDARRQHLVLVLCSPRALMPSLKDLKDKFIQHYMVATKLFNSRHSMTRNKQMVKGSQVATMVHISKVIYEEKVGMFLYTQPCSQGHRIRRQPQFETSLQYVRVSKNGECLLSLGANQGQL